MKIKLCRIFNIFNKHTIIYSSLLLFIVLIISLLYRSFYYLFLVPVFSVCYCYNYSKFLHIENQRVTYKDFKILGNRGKGKDFKYIDNKVTIEIENIKFRQNVFEKVFNVGHIYIIEKETLFQHNIYGITHFDKKNNKLLSFSSK